MSERKALLILHGKQALNEQVRAAVMAHRDRGWQLDVRLTWEAGDAQRLVAAALKMGYPTVIAGGGGGTLRDIAADQTDIVTIGQYLQPTPQHLKIDRWVHPDEFARWKEFGLGIGIGVIESGAMVRSSYHADEQSLKYTGIEHLNTANSLAEA